MNLFNRLPGHVPSAPGFEHAIWQRLPLMGLGGSVLPLILARGNRLLAGLSPAFSTSEKSLLLFDYAMTGVLFLHWMLVLGLGLGCFIVRVMKGPAYVADAYPLPDEDFASKG